MVDIAEAPLRLARERLGPRARDVRWIVADARQLSLPEPVDLWHDRAVFHFLADATGQEAYLRSLRAAVAPGGHVILATFALTGPPSCSGLPVERYDASTLARRLGPEFRLLRAIEKRHTTPAGAAQDFTYALFSRLAS